MATLAIYRGDQFERRVELTEAPMRIGRAPENEIVLEDPNKGVSRAHGEIRFEEGRYLIADLNSQNGIWIGGQRVKRDPLPIDGSVTIGPYRLVVESEPHTPSSFSRTDMVPGDPALADAEFAEPTQLAQAGLPLPAATTSVATPPVPPTRPRRLALVAGGIAAAGLGAWAVVAAINRPSEQPPPPPPTTTTTSVIADPPPPPVDADKAQREQDFKDHLDKAQAAFDAKDKTTATTEIVSALEIKAEDVSALALRDEIDKLAANSPLPVGPTPPTPPTVAPTFTVLNRLKETPKQRKDREKNARDALLAGIKQFNNGNYPAARDLLESSITLSDRKDFGQRPNEAQEYLVRISETQDATAKDQRKKDALLLIAQARELGPTDVVAAIAKVREAAVKDAANDSLPALRASLFAQAGAEADKAYSDATTYENYRNAGAAEKYERAIQLYELIPGDHRNLQSAKDKLLKLRAPK